MKKAIFIILTVMVIIFGNVKASQNVLTDINNHWAKENIVRMLINEKINGYPDKTFKPDNKITIIEFLKMIFENLNIKIAREGLNKWPDYYISTAKKYNINYDYNKIMSRYEAVDILSKVIDLKSVSNSSNRFTDLDSKYKSNVLKLVKLKILNGYEDNTFRGNSSITRAEAVSVVIRAIDANKRIINNKQYDIDSRYTNVNRSNANNSEISQLRYEISGDKIVFYDSGRFSNLENYTINEQYVSNNKIISIIKSLVSENSYTAVYYAPSKYIINQIIIKYGDNDELVNKNLDYFSIIYYEDKPYNLKDITLRDVFSNECYMKVNLKKMWKEFYQYENENYIDEDIKNKLSRALKNEFGENTQEIVDYMMRKYITSIEFSNRITEKIQIGNYIINTYKTDATSLEFYFEKLSS